MSQIGILNASKFKPGSVVQHLTGDTGGLVSPDLGNNINILGGNNITVNGNPLTNTLTVNLTGTTNHTVQVGNATGSLTSLAAALTGQGLMGTTGADPSWTGSPSFSGTVTAGTGFIATTGNVAITAGNLTLPTTTSTVGQIIVNSVPFIHSYGAVNTFVGANTGNFTLDPVNATFNVGIGSNSLNKLVGTLAGNASKNTALGVSGLYNCTNGSSNTAVGYFSLSSITTGISNTGLGDSSGSNITTGNYNTCIGDDAGTNLNGSESSCIMIGYSSGGFLGQSNKLQIGNGTGTGNGEIDAAYISGIYNKTVGATSTVVLSDSNDQIGGLPSGTSGYVLTQGATAPSWQPTLPGGINWTRETGDTITSVVNHGYINTNVGLTTYTLPATAALGTIIAIMGESSGGWKIAQNAGQSIQLGAVNTTTGVTGYLASSNQYDVVYLVCRVADTTWSVVQSMGNIIYS